MLRTRWEPLFGVNRLENEMNRLFNEWARPARALSPATYPPLNLWEDDDAYYLEAELPGLSLDDLEILVTGGNVLSIKGLRKRPVLEHGGIVRNVVWENSNAPWNCLPLSMTRKCLHRWSMAC